MRAIRTIAASLTLAAAGGSAGAQDTPATTPNKTYAPTCRFMAGELLSYAMKMTMKMEMKGEKGDLPIPPGDNNVTGTARMKTLRVKPDGTGVVQYTVAGMSIEMMGQKMQMPAMPAMTLEVDPRGRTKVIGATGTQANPMMNQFMNMQQGPSSGVLLPEHPVKVGDTWDAEIDVPGLGGKKAKATCKLLGVELLKGTEALKIEQVIDVPLNMMMGASGQPTTDEADAQMAMKGTVSINTVNHVVEKNGRLLKSFGDMAMDMTMDLKGDAANTSPFGSKMVMKMNGKIDMALVSTTNTATKPAPKPAPRKATAKKPVAKKK